MLIRRNNICTIHESLMRISFTSTSRSTNCSTRSSFSPISSFSRRGIGQIGPDGALTKEAVSGKVPIGLGENVRAYIQVIPTGKETQIETGTIKSRWCRHHLTAVIQFFIDITDGRFSSLMNAYTAKANEITLQLLIKCIPTGENLQT